MRQNMSRIEIGVIFGIVCVVGFNAFRYFNSNALAKRFGGSQTITLEVGKELEIATWKDDNLWVLLRDRKEGEQADIHVFKEYSNFGILQGTVTIVEK